MNNAFENGKRDGGSNLDPREDSLEAQEQIYQQEMKDLPELGGYAKEHEEYMQGWILGARQAFQQ